MDGKLAIWYRPASIAQRADISISLSSLALLPLIYPLIELTIAIRRSWALGMRRHRNQCLRCGYPLRGLQGRPCPECGTANAACPAVDRWLLAIATLKRVLSLILHPLPTTWPVGKQIAGYLLLSWLASIVLLMVGVRSFIWAWDCLQSGGPFRYRSFEIQWMVSPMILAGLLMTLQFPLIAAGCRLSSRSSLASPGPYRIWFVSNLFAIPSLGIAVPVAYLSFWLAFRWVASVVGGSGIAVMGRATPGLAWIIAVWGAYALIAPTLVNKCARPQHQEG